MQPLMLLIMFAAADPQIATKGEVRAGGPVIKLMELPAQSAAPDSPVTLTDGMRYVFDCKVECDVIQFPEGVLEKFDKSGPRDWTAKFPGGADESDKTFAGPFLYCLKPVVSASGEVKVIVIPRGYKDKAEWVTVKFAVNGARPPPGPTPNPDDEGKKPKPVTSFRVIFVTESATTLTAKQSAVSNAKAVRDYLNGKCTKENNWPEWRHYDPQTTITNESAGMKTLWESVKSKVTAPCMVVQVNDKVEIVPYPEDAAAGLKTLQSYGGK